MRRAVVCALSLWLTLGVAQAARAQDAACTGGDGDWIARACFEVRAPAGPVYGHDVLGGTPEWNRLQVSLGPRGRDRLDHSGGEIALALPAGRIIEDIAPRIAQVDGRGPPEIVLVISDARQGAQLAVFDLSTGRLTGTPFIGTRYRWLAPVGVADLDGDGLVELAYVDRPHLARVLRVWRFRDGRLEQVAAAEGFTNHRIGERDIAGGLRDCGRGPEMVLASADWARVLAVRLSEGRLLARDLGRHAGRRSFEAAIGCR